MTPRIRLRGWMALRALLLWTAVPPLAAQDDLSLIMMKNPRECIVPGEVTWRAGKRQGLRVQKNELVLDPTGDRGEYVSPMFTGEIPFEKAVPFWNARTPGDGSVHVSTRLFRSGEPLSGWIPVATWARGSIVRTCIGDALWIPPDPLPGPGKPAEILKPAVWLDEDTLRVPAGADGIQFRVVLAGRDPGVALTRLGAALFVGDGPAGPAPERARKLKGTSLPVPFRSQSWEDPRVSRRLCGPTSLSMILDYHRIARSTRCVARVAYDPGNDIFGNWAFLAATAGEYGFQGDVCYWKDEKSPAGGLERVYREISAGRPLVLSIRFEKGELAGAPIDRTSGHLVVVRGFDARGNLLINDPAGRDSHRGQVTYRRDEILKAWKSGVVIRVVPPGR